jgi:phage gpG-like protein
MMNFSFNTNSQTVLGGLTDFQDSLADNTSALAAVADDLREMIGEQFSTEGAAGGTPWSPLATSTLRKSRGLRSGILDLTGALKGSLTDPGAPGHVETTDGQQLLFGSELPYANFHQVGTRRMTARPIIVLTPDRITRWVEIVSGQIEEKTVLLGTGELGGRK